MLTLEKIRRRRLKGPLFVHAHKYISFIISCCWGRENTWRRRDGQRRKLKHAKSFLFVFRMLTKVVVDDSSRRQGVSAWAELKRSLIHPVVANEQTGRQAGSQAIRTQLANIRRKTNLKAVMQADDFV